MISILFLYFVFQILDFPIKVCIALIYALFISSKILKIKMNSLEEFRQFLTEKYGNITEQKLAQVAASFIQGNRFRANVTVYKFIPILTVGLLGNIAIIVYFLKIYRCRRIGKISNYHLLIVLLAMIDIVVVLLNTVDTSILKIKMAGGDASKILFGVLIVSQIGSNTTSCWMLVMLSYERFRSIVNPFKTALKKRYLLIGFISIWVSCIMVSAPVYMVLFFTGKSHYSDGIQSDESILFSITLLVLDCILPLTILAFFNYRISRYLKKNTFSHCNEAPKHQASSSTAEEAVTSSTYSLSVQYRQKRKNENTNKTLRNLVIIYICCVWPGRFLNIALFFVIKYKMLLYLDNYMIACILEESLDFLMFLNNVINVFVYAFLIPKFRSFLWKLVSCGTYSGRN